MDDFLKALNSQREGRYGDALDIYSKLASRTDDELYRGSLLLNCARCSGVLGRYSEAWHYYDDAFEILQSSDEYRTRAVFTRAELLDWEGKTYQAEPLLRWLWEYLLATVSNDWDVEDLRKAVRREFGLVLSKQNSAEESESLLEPYASDPSDDIVAYFHARNLLGLHRKREALDVLTAAIALSTDKRWQQALTELKRSILPDPQS